MTSRSVLIGNNFSALLDTVSQKSSTTRVAAVWVWCYRNTAGLTLVIARGPDLRHDQWPWCSLPPVRRWHAAPPRHECQQHSCTTVCSCRMYHWCQTVLHAAQPGQVGGCNRRCCKSAACFRCPLWVCIFQWLRMWRCWVLSSIGAWPSRNISMVGHTVLKLIWASHGLHPNAHCSQTHVNNCTVRRRLVGCCGHCQPLVLTNAATQQPHFDIPCCYMSCDRTMPAPWQSDQASIFSGITLICITWWVAFHLQCIISEYQWLIRIALCSLNFTCHIFVVCGSDFT